MSLLISAFEGFSDQDFETYAPACWSNNRYNLPRMKVKERLMALASEAGLAREGWALDASSEIPAVWNGRSVRDQWVYLIRDQATRARLEPLLNQGQGLMAQVQDPAKHHQHVIFGIRIDAEALAFGVWLHARAALDRAQLIARAEAEPEAFAAALEPTGIEPQALLAQLHTPSDDPWIFIGERVIKAEAEPMGAEIKDAVRARFEALEALLGFAAWTEAQDLTGLLSQLEAHDEARKVREEALAKEQEEAEVARAKRREEAIERAQIRQADEDLWRERRRKHRAERRAAEKAAAEAAAKAEAAQAEARAKAQAAAEARAEARAKAAAEAGEAPEGKATKKAVAAPAGLALGTRVRLERGLLAGKEGEISALSGAYIKVRVGPLEVNVKADDLRAL